MTLRLTTVSRPLALALVPLFGIFWACAPVSPLAVRKSCFAAASCISVPRALPARSGPGRLPEYRTDRGATPDLVEDWGEETEERDDLSRVFAPSDAPLDVGLTAPPRSHPSPPRAVASRERLQFLTCCHFAC
jgi:hypothetical protein